MSVPRRFDGIGLPCLVTTNTDGRKPTFRSDAAIRMLLGVIGEVRRDTGVEIFAWVVMPDHVHLVLRVSPPLAMGRFMQLMKGRFAKRYNEFQSGQGRVWQDRYHARVLASERAVAAAIEYVHHNPVAAGLVTSQEEYRWSSARLFAGVEGRGVEAIPG